MKSQELNDYNSAINDNPNNPYLYFKKGLTLVELDRKRGGIDFFNKAIKIKPSYGIVYYHKGKALYDLGRYEESLECFNNAIKFGNSEYYCNYLEKSKVLNRLGRYEEFLECCNKAISIAEDSEINLLKAEALLGLDRIKGSINFCNKAIKLNKSEMKAYVIKAKCIAQLTENKEESDYENEFDSLKAELLQNINSSDLTDLAGHIQDVDCIIS